MTRIGKEYQKPAWGLPATEIDGKSVRITEAVALDKPFCRLVHFHRDVRHASQKDPKVLLVAPLSAIMPRCCATPCAPCCPPTTST